MEEEEELTFKVLLVGNDRHLHWHHSLLWERVEDEEFDFQNNFVVLGFSTTCGEIRFQCWYDKDVNNFEGIRAGVVKFDAGLIVFRLFDVQELQNNKGTAERMRLLELGRLWKTIPVALCGYSHHNHHLRASQTIGRKKNWKYFEVRGSFERAFMWLATQLCEYPTLEFVERVALCPPEIQLSPEEIARYQLELAQAQALPLPHEYDSD